MNLDQYKNAYILVSPYGLGDTYILGSLAFAFKKKYCLKGERLVLVVKPGHKELAELFMGVDEVVCEDLSPSSKFMNLAKFRGDTGPIPGYPFFAHPEFEKVRPDHCVAYGKMSDQAMYAMILGLPPDTFSMIPQVSSASRAQARELFGVHGFLKEGRTVVLFPHANSWRPPDLRFWADLTKELNNEGWTVFSNAHVIPLGCIVSFVELCGWVIGANSGIMQTIVMGQAACRKTVITRSLEGVTDYPLPTRSAFPYRYMRTVSGYQYDIEEFELKHNNEDQIIKFIAKGRNAKGPVPNPWQVFHIEAPTTPGDIIDRLSILHVKLKKLPHKAHLLYRELAELETLVDQVQTDYKNCALFKDLFKLNEIAWDNNQILMDYFDNNDLGPGGATGCFYALRAAHRANQQRVHAKNIFNENCGCVSTEVKSYEFEK